MKRQGFDPKGPPDACPCFICLPNPSCERTWLDYTSCEYTVNPRIEAGVSWCDMTVIINHWPNKSHMQGKPHKSAVCPASENVSRPFVDRFHEAPNHWDIECTSQVTSDQDKVWNLEHRHNIHTTPEHAGSLPEYILPESVKTSAWVAQTKPICVYIIFYYIFHCEGSSRHNRLMNQKSDRKIIPDDQFGSKNLVNTCSV